MGYWGTVVLARLDRLLTDRPEAAAFGHRYQRLRDLGGGWQILETNAFVNEPDPAAATEGWFAATGEPVLEGEVELLDAIHELVVAGLS